MAYIHRYQKQKVNVTLLLQNALKQLRKEFNKRGDILSKELGKGASYISQLENGKIKEIEYDFLMEIFQTITCMSGDAFINYFSNFIDKVLLSCKNKEALEPECWIHIFIVQDIKYPISNWIISFIKNKLGELHQSPENLVEKINTDGFRNRYSPTMDYIPNKAYVSTSSGQLDAFDDSFSVYIFASFNLDKYYISDILCGKINSINYMTMQIIFETLFLLESDHGAIAKTKTAKIMKDNHFFDTYEKYDLLFSNNKSEEEIINSNEFIFYDDLILNYQKKYKELKKELFEKMDDSLSRYYSANQAYSCEAMEKILKNFRSDAGLVLALLNSPLYKLPLEERPYFLKAYKNLLENYSK